MNTLFRIIVRTSGLLVASLSLSACSTPEIKLWPFGDKPSAGSGGLANATELKCAGGKSFHVRYLDGGNAAWVIFPERQVRLDKVAGDAGNRYSNGVAVLKIEGASTSLTDGPNMTYSDCKSAADLAKKAD